MKEKNPLEDLQEIRKMMEGSSKFLSLSGLSGVFAGISALLGAFWAWIEISSFSKRMNHYAFSGKLYEESETLTFKLYFIAVLILVTAISFGILFTWLKAKKNKQSITSPLSLRLIRSLLVPLSMGGLFTIGLLYHHHPVLTSLGPGMMLIFYGLALLNASKYVHVDIKYLALCQMALGVLAVFMLDKPWSGILLWAIGFGVLHIVYGTIMYFKYDRKKD